MSEAPVAITSDTLDDDIPEDDAVCSVCGFSEIGEHNPIIMCDSCQVCVHTQCYNISDEALQKEKWFCLPCSKGLLPRNADGTPNQYRRCVACSHIGGAFSQTTDGRWVHTSCAMHLQGVSFTMEGVTLPRQQPGQIPPECVLCKKKFGLTRKCSFLDCNNYMHIHCMTRHECLIDGFAHPTSHGQTVECVFCPTHSKVAETSYDQLATVIRHGEVAVCTIEEKEKLDKERRTQKREKPTEGSSSDTPITITTTRSGRDVKRPYDLQTMLHDKAAIDAINYSLTDDQYPSTESDSDPEPHRRHRRRSTKQKEDGPTSPRKEQAPGAAAGAGEGAEAERMNAQGTAAAPLPKRRGRKSLAQKQAEAAAAAAQAAAAATITTSTTTTAPSAQQPATTAIPTTTMQPVGQLVPPAGQVVTTTSHLGQPAPMLLSQHQMPQHVPMGMVTNGPAPNPYPVPFNIQPSLPPSIQPQLTPSGLQNHAVLVATAAVQAQNPNNNPQ